MKKNRYYFYSTVTAALFSILAFISNLIDGNNSAAAGYFCASCAWMCCVVENMRWLPVMRNCAIKIHKPEDSENQPHLWTIIDSTGMHVAVPCRLIPEAREKQAELILKIVDAYNQIAKNETGGL